MNPVIKFTTLFGLLAVELAVSLSAQGLGVLTKVLAAVLFAISAFFVYRSFYGMRIETAGRGSHKPQVQIEPDPAATPVMKKVAVLHHDEHLVDHDETPVVLSRAKPKPDK